MAQGDGGQVEWLDELVKALRGLHDQIIKESGGVLTEHTSSLYAACGRPLQTAFGKDIHAGPFEKAGALFHAIICDHVFVDGNKRTATVGTIHALVAQGVVRIEDLSRLKVRLLGDVALATAAEGLTVEEIKSWLHRIFDESLLPGQEA
jgi:prophage maintenance system killer protein